MILKLGLEKLRNSCVRRQTYRIHWPIFLDGKLPLMLYQVCKPTFHGANGVNLKSGFFTSLAYGALADKWGRRPVMTIACTGEMFNLLWLVFVCECGS